MWSAIPEGVDILLTHMPPFNRLDLAFDRGTHAKVDPCPVCGETHRRYGMDEELAVLLECYVLVLAVCAVGSPLCRQCGLFCAGGCPP